MGLKRKRGMELGSVGLPDLGMDQIQWKSLWRSCPLSGWIPSLSNSSHNLAQLNILPVCISSREFWMQCWQGGSVGRHSYGCSLLLRHHEYALWHIHNILGQCISRCASQASVKNCSHLAHVTRDRCLTQNVIIIISHLSKFHNRNHQWC